MTSRVGAATLVALSLVACSGRTTSQPPTAATIAASSVAPSNSAPSEAAATPAAKPSATPGPGDVVYNGRIDVGGGRKLEVRCAGVGSPTIVLEGGGITPSVDAFPSAFFFELAKTTTTCQYARAGAGMSSPPAGARTMAGLVGDVYAMLAALEQASGVPGPYIFAGWSFGGEVALADALAHPDQTAGLVILDTDFVVDFMTVCQAASRTKADCQAEFDGDIDAKALEAELVPQIHPLPDIPLRIVSATKLPGCDASDPLTLHASIGGRDVSAKDCPTLAKKVADLQHEGWSTVNPKLDQTLVEADHDGLIAQAGDHIASIILEVVAAARSTS